MIKSPLSKPTLPRYPQRLRWSGGVWSSNERGTHASPYGNRYSVGTGNVGRGGASFLRSQTPNQSVFKATGIKPFNPMAIYSKLSIQVRTPSIESSPDSNLNSTRSSLFATPHNLRSLRKKDSSLKRLLDNASNSPPTPTKTAIRQIVKGCEMAMHGMVLLTQENAELRRHNAEKNEKASRSRKRIKSTTGLSITEGLELINSRRKRKRASTVSNLHIAATNQQPKRRATARCSTARCFNCKRLSHKKNKCIYTTDI